MIDKHLKGQVPAPEVFGWAEDEGQIFIYMSLVEGETLQERWGTMDVNERLSVCEEARCIVKAWRSLKQDGHDHYIENAGPLQGLNAVQQFQDACGIEINEEAPVVFTHDDLIPPNILLSSGPNPRVAAVIDRGQTGWYPSYWEYSKTRCIRPSPQYFNDATEEEWKAKHLPMILDPVDDETIYHPWLYFVSSKGI